MNFKGTVSMVTGAARGIGKAISKKLFDLGSKVILVDLDKDMIEKTAEEFSRLDPERVVTMICNVAKPDDVESMFRKVKEEVGQLDFLVNNAGITRDNIFMRMKFEQWEQVIAVNLTGTYLCSRYAVNLLRKSERGRIINLSSVAAKGNPGQANYAASKAGVIGLTKTLALELARYNITVNAVAPGFIDTEMTKAIPEKARQMWIEKIPSKRIGTVDDVAEAVTFLLSDSASYITGQVLGVDGGLGI